MGRELEGKEGKWKELGRGQAKRMLCTFIRKRKKTLPYNIEGESNPVVRLS